MKRQLSPAERSERARLAAQTRWSKPGARKRQSEAISAAQIRRHENLVDPNRTLDPAERQACAKASLSAEMSRLRLGRLRRNAEG